MASIVTVNQQAINNTPDQSLQVDQRLLYEHDFPGQAFVSAHLKRLQHGVFTQDSKETMHVTFAAITFTMHPTLSMSHRFVSAAITITVRSKDEPIRFLKFAPHLAYGRIKSASLKWNVPLGATVSAPQGPMNLSSTPSTDHNMDRMAATTVKVQGSSRSTVHCSPSIPHGPDRVTNPHLPQRRPDTKLVWTLEENNEQKTGLPLEFTFIFLMERPCSPSTPSLTSRTLPPMAAEPARTLNTMELVARGNMISPWKPNFPAASPSMRLAQSPDVEKPVTGNVGVGPTKPMFPVVSPTKKIVVNLSKSTEFSEAPNMKVLPRISTPASPNYIPTLDLGAHIADQAPSAPVGLKDKNKTPRGRGEAKPKDGFFHQGIFLHSSQVSLRCLEDRTEHEAPKISARPLDDYTESKAALTSLKTLEHRIQPQPAQALNRLSPQFLPLDKSNFATPTEERKAFLNHLEDIPEKLDLYDTDMESDSAFDGQEDLKTLRRFETGIYKSQNNLAIVEHIEDVKFHEADIKSGNHNTINMQECMQPLKARLKGDITTGIVEHVGGVKLLEAGVKGDKDRAISTGIQEDMSSYNTRIKHITTSVVEHAEEVKLYNAGLKGGIKTAALQTLADLKPPVNLTPPDSPFRYKEKSDPPNTDSYYDLIFAPLNFNVWVEPQISGKKGSELAFPAPDEVISIVSGEVGRRFHTGQSSSDGEEFVNGLYNFAKLPGIFD